MRRLLLRRNMGLVDMERQHLIIDADDTLWENNIHFERAIEEFLDFLDHSTLTRAEARAVLDEIERANAGSMATARAHSPLPAPCYEHLAERELDAEEIRDVMGFGERILSQEIELYRRRGDAARRCRAARSDRSSRRATTRSSG